MGGEVRVWLRVWLRVRGWIGFDWEMENGFVGVGVKDCFGKVGMN